MNPDTKEILAARFRELPSVVQRAITSAHVEEHLRTLATKHKLHLDKGVMLENEVMLVLLGIQPIDKMAESIAQELQIPLTDAQAVAFDASEIIFRPIEEELERELENPNAKASEVSVDEESRQSALTTARAEEQRIVGSPAVLEQKAAPKSLASDPYRELV